MRITSVRIHHFGKIKERELSFSPGINVIYGENESGKSTLHTFLRAMLFGIRRGRGRASRQDEFSRHEPWENPAGYGGTLRFESGGKEFRLTRRFARGDVRAELVCETDGELLNLEQGDLEMLLGNVSLAVFDNTVSVGQLKSRTESELFEALRNYMANCQDGGSGALDLGKAQELLKARQREEERLEKQEQQAVLERQRDLEQRMEYVRQEQEQLLQRQKREAKRLERMEAGEPEKDESQNGRTGAEGRKAPLKGAEELPRGAEERFQEASEQLRRLRKGPGFLAPGAALLFLGLAAVIFWLLPLPGTLKAPLLAVLGLLALGVVYLAVRQRLLWRKLIRKKLKEIEVLKQERQERVEQERRQEQDMRQAARLTQTEEKGRLKGSLESLQENLAEKETELQNLQADYEECLEQRNRRSERQDRIKGLELARKTIEELAADHKGRYGGRLQERVSEIMAELTGGKYHKAALGEDFKLWLHAGDKLLSLEQVSRGTADQLYFSLRMAAGELLCGEEPLPLLLDEAFAMYDRERLAAALRWLAKNREQTLLFTCQEREAEILKELGLPYNLIRLDRREEVKC